MSDLKKRIIPVLLLKNNKLVKTVKFKKSKYIGDPINTIKLFNDKFCDEIIVLDISKNISKPNFALIDEIATECFMPITYGGGIRCMEHADKLFHSGIEKISINKTLWSNTPLVHELVQTYGSQSVVASIDLKSILGKYLIHVDLKQYFRQIKKSKLLDEFLKIQKLGIGEILVNFMDLDGTYKGFDQATIKELADNISIPLTVCGGCSSYDDIRNLMLTTDVSGIAAGSLFVYSKKDGGVLVNYSNAEKIMEKVL